MNLSTISKIGNAIFAIGFWVACLVLSFAEGTENIFSEVPWWIVIGTALLLPIIDYHFVKLWEGKPPVAPHIFENVFRSTQFFWICSIGHILIGIGLLANTSLSSVVADTDDLKPLVAGIVLLSQFTRLKQQHRYCSATEQKYSGGVPELMRTVANGLKRILNHKW
jgi:hypothetical protein